MRKVQCKHKSTTEKALHSRINVFPPHLFAKLRSSVRSAHERVREGATHRFCRLGAVIRTLIDVHRPAYKDGIDRVTKKVGTAADRPKGYDERDDGDESGVMRTGRMSGGDDGEVRGESEEEGEGQRDEVEQELEQEVCADRQLRRYGEEDEDTQSTVRPVPVLESNQLAPRADVQKPSPVTPAYTRANELNPSTAAWAKVTKGETA